jgi:thiol-disulfide isomerase/thioredoxin
MRMIFLKYRNLILTCIILLIVGIISYKIYDYYKLLDYSNGANVPELIYPDTDGKQIPLSSLKGNIVLIHFWAAWCGPCRMENPELVKLYNEYHDKQFKKASGFQIYSISLDYQRDQWVNAIKQDGLTWPYHVSTLKGFDSEAAIKFGVRSIPANLLIDQDGMIIGSNLTINEIKKVLERRKQ